MIRRDAEANRVRRWRRDDENNPVYPVMLLASVMCLHPLKHYCPENTFRYLHSPSLAWGKQDTSVLSSMADFLPLERGNSYSN
jgi:hypothetical protein